jgi:hypothetical protein
MNSVLSSFVHAPHQSSCSEGCEACATSENSVKRNFAELTFHALR